MNIMKSIASFSCNFTKQTHTHSKIKHSESKLQNYACFLLYCLFFLFSPFYFFIQLGYTRNPLKKEFYQIIHLILGYLVRVENDGKTNSLPHGQTNPTKQSAGRDIFKLRKRSLVLSDQLTDIDYNKGQTRTIILPGDTHIQGDVANKREQQRELREIDEELEKKMVLENLGKDYFKTMWSMFVNITIWQNRM